MANKFSVQHYNAIAKIWRDSIVQVVEATDDDASDLIATEAFIDTLLENLSNYFQNDNDRFDPAKFKAACTAVDVVDGAVKTVSPGGSFPAHRIK